MQLNFDRFLSLCLRYLYFLLLFSAYFRLLPFFGGLLIAVACCSNLEFNYLTIMDVV